MVPSKFQNVLPLAHGDVSMPLPPLRPGRLEVMEQILKVTSKLGLRTKISRGKVVSGFSPYPFIFNMDDLCGRHFRVQRCRTIQFNCPVALKTPILMINLNKFGLQWADEKVDTLWTRLAYVAGDQLRICKPPSTGISTACAGKFFFQRSKRKETRIIHMLGNQGIWWGEWANIRSPMCV